MLPAYIDSHGTERFVPNEVVSEGFDAGLINLNEIAFMCCTANVPLKDQIVFWAMLGYSVSGMCNLSFMENVEVESRRWNND